MAINKKRVLINTLVLLAVSLVFGAATTLTAIRENSIDTNEMNEKLFVQAANYTDILAQRDACPSIGCEIELPSGQYNMTESLTIENKNNIIIRGQGDSTVLNVSSGGDFDAIVVNNSNHIQILDVLLDGNEPEQTSTGDGIIFDDTTNSKLDVTVMNTYRDGVVLTGNSNSNEINVRCIEIGRSGTADGDGIVIRSNYNYGNIFTNNTVGDGILLKGSYNKFDAVILNSLSGGLVLSTENNHDVMNNEINLIVDNSTLNNVILNRLTSEEMKFNKITGISTNSGEYGVYLSSGSSYNTIDMVATDNTLKGILLVGGTDYNKISGTYVNNTGGQISIQAGSDYNQVDAVGNINGLTNNGNYNLVRYNNQVYDALLDNSIMSNGAGLLAYWAFDEYSGTLAYDSSYNMNKGTLENGPSWVDGKFGSALSFDGSNDNVEVPNAASLQLTNLWTITMWTKATDTETNGNMISQGDVWSNGAQSVSLASSKYRVGAYGCSGADANSNFVANTWYFLTGIRNTTHMILYIDGVMQDDITACSIANTTFAGIEDWNIGSLGAGGSAYNGTIDEIKVWNRVLTDQEIQSEYILSQSSHSSTGGKADLSGTNYRSSAAPFTCASTGEGALWMETDGHTLCYCNSTDWVKTSDDTTVCT